MKVTPPGKKGEQNGVPEVRQHSQQKRIVVLKIHALFGLHGFFVHLTWLLQHLLYLYVGTAWQHLPLQSHISTRCSIDAHLNIYRAAFGLRLQKQR
jgi:uncharacterized iron-regulated membrane protein